MDVFGVYRFDYVEYTAYFMSQKMKTAYLR